MLNGTRAKLFMVLPKIARFYMVIESIGKFLGWQDIYVLLKESFDVSVSVQVSLVYWKSFTFFSLKMWNETKYWCYRWLFPV
jgi:hypothetical protein